MIFSIKYPDEYILNIIYLMKNIGVLFPTISQFPSSVYIFTANPRGSLDNRQYIV